MIYVFVPYYNEDSDGFKRFINNQNYKEFKLIRRDRKRDGIYWTRACNDFYKDIKRYRGVKDDDIICIMNNDIVFLDDYLRVGSKVKQGEIFVCDGITIDWKHKKFFRGSRVDTFPGRAFFMTAKDFMQSGGFCKWLPHYLSDIDFGIKMVKKGLKVYEMVEILHPEHKKEERPFSILSPHNPIFWTIFLLKNFNRYTFINIIKAWITALRLLKQLHVTKSILTVRDGI